jgi:endonuclease YncB( thermonuclease family)
MVGVQASAMVRFLFAFLFALSPIAGQAQSVVGAAAVIDGDTLDVNGQRFRLFGVDAPEIQQSCSRGQEDWACGTDAGRQLATLIAGRTVRCETRDTDAYGRIVAVCRAGSMDLAQAMVQTGFALAFRRYSLDYVADEAVARSAGRGLWSSTFTVPSEWRAARRRQNGGGEGDRSGRTDLMPAPVATGEGDTCLIKGNINRRGEHIYHMPGMPYYEATRPERMFCSEAEARAAGFRRAMVR